MTTERSIQNPDRPSTARMYDYFLHGDSSYPVDRAAGDIVLNRLGRAQTTDVVWENRRFLGRVVDRLARTHGVEQFIDLGAGLPSMENTHQVARASRPDARVLYVDIDPAVAEHGRKLLTAQEQAITRIVTADIREPGAILDHPHTRELIDFSQPVAVLFIAVLHFVTDAEDPGGIVGAFASRMAGGSYLALSHLAVENTPAAEITAMEEIYQGTSATIHFRTGDEITGFTRGFDLLPPGIVPVGRWNPEAGAASTDRMYGGLARKR